MLPDVAGLVRAAQLVMGMQRLPVPHSPRLAMTNGKESPTEAMRPAKHDEQNELILRHHSRQGCPLLPRLTVSDWSVDGAWTTSVHLLQAIELGGGATPLQDFRHRSGRRRRHSHPHHPNPWASDAFCGSTEAPTFLTPSDERSCDRA